MDGWMDGRTVGPVVWVRIPIPSFPNWMNGMERSRKSFLFSISRADYELVTYYKTKNWPTRRHMSYFLLWPLFVRPFIRPSIRPSCCKKSSNIVKFVEVIGIVFMALLPQLPLLPVFLVSSWRNNDASPTAIILLSVDPVSSSASALQFTKFLSRTERSLLSLFLSKFVVNSLVVFFFSFLF